MTKFPLERDAWYQARDDRTKRVDGVSGFEVFRLGVLVNPQVESSYSLQVMTVTALNMLARWCRKLVVQVPSDARSCLPSNNGQNLKEALAKDLSAIDPYGQFDFDDKKIGDCNQTLVIGQPEKPRKLPSEQSVWIDGSEWIAGMGYGMPTTPLVQNEICNPVGPAFASCLGVAEVFRQAIGLPPSHHKSSWYSLYNYSKVNSPDKSKDQTSVHDFDFGRIHQVGCGAVASSLDYFLSLTNWKAELHLIDYDHVDVTNCNRALTFTAYDAVNNCDKADSCASVLSKGVHPVKFRGSYADFIGAGKFRELPADLILCLANEKNVWADIQHNLPPLVFHATTTQSWGVNFGRHIPQKEWCIMCRFANEIDHNFTPVCGEGEISIKGPEKKYQGVLPFLSATAAVLVLAEMAKMSLPDYPTNNNFVEFSMKASGADFLSLQRSAEKGCVCNEQSPDIYLKEITSSKFWHLSVS